MNRIVELLQAKGVANAYVEQTGGGCATIYAGPTHLDGNGDERWAVCAGPGWFTNGGGAFGDRADFYIGPDDDGEAPLDELDRPTEDTTDEQVAEMILRQIAKSSANA